MIMSPIDDFKLTFSEGTPWILAFLKKCGKKLHSSEALKVSSKLYKTILKVNEEIVSIGHPPNLQLAYVDPTVNTGVFLQCKEKPIQRGTFIGIYTGHYELVEGDIATGTSYAYDVAQDISLQKKDLVHLTYPQKSLEKKISFSIQTNAMNKGNFTRYINHSSLNNNIEAVVSKFLDGRIEVLLFALKKIAPGEQLLSNYGGQYWKALGVIPDDMSPKTYLITSSGSLKRGEKTPSFSPKEKQILLSLRNIETTLPKSLEKKAFVKKLIQETPVLLKKHKKELDLFEELVLERGIPRKFTLRTLRNKTKVSLNSKEKPIPKNSLIGSIAGIFSLAPSFNALLLKTEKRSSLYLDLSQETNFLSLLSRHEKKSNLQVRLSFDSEDGSLKVLVFSSKRITPGEELLF